MKIDSMVSQHKTGTTASLGERALLQCARAKVLEEAGEFEDARKTISEFWQRIGERPLLEGLDDAIRAEVLLRSGTLSGWIGSARQISGAQEIAKDLISDSAAIFEQLGMVERAAEAHIDLAICYWREGGYDEARVMLNQAASRLGPGHSDQRLRALLNSALVERSSMRYGEAIRIHKEAAPLFEVSGNHALIGKFHNEYATVLKNLGLAESREDYIDQALLEYSAAGFHAEQAGNNRFLALVENNVGYMFVQLGRFPEAQSHLDRARSLFTALNDKGMVAQVDDTLALALIALGRFSKAETLARKSVRVLEEGDELSLLAGALTTHGTALARLGNYSKARATLEKAIRIAHNAGDPESGGVAALAMAEELAEHLPFNEVLAYYRIAESELINSQHPTMPNRLGKCARRVLTHQALLINADLSSFASPSSGNGSSHSQPSVAQADPESVSMDASLEDKVLLYEANLIKRALEASDGSVTRAARMLGVSHQGLAFILNGRQKDLLPARKPVKRRRRSIIRFH